MLKFLEIVKTLLQIGVTLLPIIILKLKNLLDSGIITQEEFDLKKKEILGL